MQRAFGSGRRGAAPRDFDRIGTEFHRWVREREESLGLVSDTEFARFIEEDFSFYGHWYARLREAAATLTEGLESVRYCALEHNFTLQYPVLLAPLRREDREQDILRKLRVVSAFLDVLISRRIWNWRAIGYSTMQYAMFLVMREIRGMDVRPFIWRRFSRSGWQARRRHSLEMIVSGCTGLTVGKSTASSRA